METDQNIEHKSKIFLAENKAWEYMFSVYKEFFLKHGTQSISSKYINENGESLGSWFRYQRQRFDANLLSSECTYLLNKVNPDWSKREKNGRSAGDRTIQWDNRFQLVKEFIEEFGSPVPARTQYKNKNIGYWLVRQRTSFDKNLLESTQIERLKSISIIKEENGELNWSN